MPVETLLIVVIVALAAMVALQLVAVIRGGSAGRAASSLEERLVALARDNERLERELREAIGEGRRDAHEAARVQREELAAALSRTGAELRDQLGGLSRLQSERMEAFSRDLAALTQGNEARLEALHGDVNERLGAFQESSGRNLAILGQEHREGRLETTETLRRFGASLEQRLGEVRATLEAKLKELAADNAHKLEQMRQTVDEKLHATLENRLSESFKLVSERLEQVHRGLGEMQTLAAGVGDLKRVLTNVKSRGLWGEIQLGALLEQTLAPEQYAANVATRPGSQDRVEFAIRLPGRDADRDAVWLPIDAKFPREDYERLLEAQERADLAAADEAGKAIEARIKLEARSIRDKYLEPPGTTDFAVMFLPTEGLYAEVLRRPGLCDVLQREYRVTVSGPTTLMAFLNSLQMGFRTLAIEKRSSEVWQVLGGVKTEFGRFGDMLAKTREKLEQATRTLGQAETRTRAIQRRLRDVEALPDPTAHALLDEPLDAEANLELGVALPERE